MWRWGWILAGLVMKKGTATGTDLIVQTSVWVPKWRSPFLGCFSLEMWNRWWGGDMKYHRNHEGKCRNPISNLELLLSLLENYLLILLSITQLHDRLAQHPFEKRLVGAIAASKAYCGVGGTQNFWAWAVEVMPLVLIVAIGDDFCDKSLENSNDYVGKILL